MNKRPTQKNRILNYMRLYGSITPLDAIREFGCMRLASRIAELREDGIAIKATIEQGTNQFGETVHFARYRIV